MVYEPAEDSVLLKRNIKDYAKGKVLDMGTGPGILAEEAKKYASFVMGADIDKEAVEYCKDRIAGVKFIQSDLFSNINEKFDTILFNPPYLPSKKVVQDPALDGGKHGYELIGRFIEQVPEHMEKDGRVLLLFSSYSKKERIEEIIKKNCLDFFEIDRENLFFEKLYVYLIKKSPLLKELEAKGVSHVGFFAKGKRGLVYKGSYNGKNVVIKSENPDSEALGRIANEAKMLEKLNEYKIGPSLIFSGKGYLVIEFIEGGLFPDFIKNNEKKKIKLVLDKIFRQLQMLDELGVNKEEMHRPNKHIIVNENPVLIDFERAAFRMRANNITQFIKYLTSKKIYPVLVEKGFGFVKEKAIEMGIDYRKGKINACKIREYIKNS